MCVMLLKKKIKIALSPKTWNIINIVRIYRQITTMYQCNGRENMTADRIENIRKLRVGFAIIS